MSTASFIELCSSVQTEHFRNLIRHNQCIFRAVIPNQFREWIADCLIAILAGWPTFLQHLLAFYCYFFFCFACDALMLMLSARECMTFLFFKSSRAHSLGVLGSCCVKCAVIHNSSVTCATIHIPKLPPISPGIILWYPCPVSSACWEVMNSLHLYALICPCCTKLRAATTTSSLRRTIGDPCACVCVFRKCFETPSFFS